MSIVDGHLDGRPNFVTDAWTNPPEDDDPDRPYPTDGVTEGTELDPFEGQPIPLSAPPPSLEFPVWALPKPLADMVDAVAESTQTDVAMAGTSALSMLAALAGGRAIVEVRQDYREQLCLFTVTVAAPGERKSAVQGAMTAPLWELERELAEQAAPHRSEAITRQDIATKAAEKARADAGKAKAENRDKATAEAISAQAEADSITVPPVPRLIADDATPEAVAGLLFEHDGRMAIVSAEGGIFGTIAGRYTSGKVPNLDIFLKGHVGDPVNIDRRGRPHERIERPALTLALMIQPVVLADVVSDRDFSGRGLVDRFFYARPASLVGHRNPDPEPIPTHVRDEYLNRLLDLGRMLTAASETLTLTLSPAADQTRIELADKLEPLLDPRRGRLAYMTQWANKWVGSVVRIAGLFHLADLMHGSADVPISEGTFARAIEIGRYYLDQANSVYDDADADEGTRDAVYLLDRIRSTGADEISERDMMRAARRYKTKADLIAPLARLIDAGWLAPVAVVTIGPQAGRPPSPSYHVHPNAYTENA